VVKENQVVIEISVGKLRAKLALAAAALAVCALLAFAMLTSFIAGVLTDERVTVSRDLLDRKSVV